MPDGENGFKFSYVSQQSSNAYAIYYKYVKLGRKALFLHDESHRNFNYLK